MIKICNKLGIGTGEPIIVQRDEVWNVSVPDSINECEWITHQVLDMHDVGSYIIEDAIAGGQRSGIGERGKEAPGWVGSSRQAMDGDAIFDAVAMIARCTGENMHFMPALCQIARELAGEQFDTADVVRWILVSDL